MHVIGASGTGKSTLLFNLIRQDIESGQGVAVLDPHGDLVDSLLGVIPKSRVEDVVLIDPADEEFSVGFNVLAAHSDFEKSLLASDLVSVFQRLSTSWGDQMNSILRNAILAFVESTEGGTLSDLRRFLLDGPFRNRFLETVTDTEIVYYWRKAFPQLTGNRSIGPVVTRLDEFLSRKTIRYMVSQKENRVNFSDVLDCGRILLAKLSQGEIGRENSYLLGSLLLSKLQQTAMARQRMRESERRDFWCYVDEFHCFITPSMAEILTGARKYRVGLVLAHQELRQMQAQAEVASAVLSNPYTRVVFRVGDADARALESGFSHFEARDLQNLETGRAICRVERSDSDFNLSVRPSKPTSDDADNRREEVIDASRRKYARPRAEVESDLRKNQSTAEDLGRRTATRPDSTAAAHQPGERKPDRPVSDEASGATASTDSEKERGGTETQGEATTFQGDAENSASSHPISPEQDSGPVPEENSPVRIPKDLGRGGAQHQAIQQRLKTAAEALGFRATLEKETHSRRGSVDLALDRPPHSIACEISISTTIDHEVGNVSKCMQAGYPAIAVICTEIERLAKIEAAVSNSLGPEVSGRSKYFLPDEFINYLAGLPKEQEHVVPKEEKRRGYKVKRNIVQISPEELLRQEHEAFKTIRKSLNPKPAESKS